MSEQIHERAAAKSLVSLDRIYEIYQKILLNPSFQTYEGYVTELDLLYRGIEDMPLASYKQSKVIEILEMHMEISKVILNEKEMLGQEIILLNKKKQASNNYGNSSFHNLDGGAFFVDLKSK